MSHTLMRSSDRLSGRGNNNFLSSKLTCKKLENWVQAREESLSDGRMTVSQHLHSGGKRYLKS